MRFNVLILSAAVGSASAYPGMAKLMNELMTRQAPPPVPEPLIGDLATEGATTPVGQAVLSCISGTGPCQDTNPKTYVPPGTLGSSACAADTCCVWDFVAQDLVKIFRECDGTCSKLARSAIRFGFHDAAAWNLKASHGGADGSLFLNSEEISRPENRGLQEWHAEGNKILAKYESYGVGAADFAQFAHNVAVVVCPLGPRGLTYVGREDSDEAAIPGQLPSPFSDADTLIDLFEAKSTSFRDLIALIGAHSTATQRFVDPAKAGQPLDSTPGIWDVKYYEEVLAGAPPPGVFRFQSDDNLNTDNRTHGGVVAFANPTNGQRAWNGGYARAYTRMSLFGVNKINQLTDCTHVLPSAQPVFNGTGTGFKEPVCSSPSASSYASRGPASTGAPFPSGGPRPSGSFSAGGPRPSGGDSPKPSGGPKPSDSYPGSGPKPSGSHPGDEPKPSDSYPGNGPKPSNSYPGSGPKPSGHKPGDGEGDWPKPSGGGGGYPGGHPGGDSKPSEYKPGSGEGGWPKPSGVAGGHPGDYPGAPDGSGSNPSGEYPDSGHGHAGGEDHPDGEYHPGGKHPAPPKPTGAPEYPAAPAGACRAHKVQTTSTVTVYE